MGKFALIPVMPTPNGPLHLGHIAGPYLKMDVLARHLRSKGHLVALVSASDSHETHVLPKAIARKASPQEICSEFHGLIKQSYSALNIELDAYLDPLDTTCDVRLREINKSLFSEFRSRGRITLLEEKVPYSTKYHWPLVGSLVGGTCPVCGVDDAAGFHCEECGAENSPSELLDTRSELEGDEWEWRTYTSAFLKIEHPHDLLRSLYAIVDDHELINIAQLNLKRSGGLVRLSHPGHWGIPFEFPGASDQSVVFSYPALLSLSALCGDYCLNALNEECNPLFRTSDVTTVMSFGFDNTVPLMVGVHGQAMQSNTIRPYSHYLTNRFWTLDGQKFSTSRNHAIWAHSAQTQLGSSPDLIRLYLATLSGATQRIDFSTLDFRRFRDRFKHALRDALSTSQQLNSTQSAKLRRSSSAPLETILHHVDRSLDLHAFKLAEAAHATERMFLDWDATRKIDLQTFLFTASVVGHPFMPTFCQEIWHSIGAPGGPSHDALRTINPAALTVNTDAVQSLVASL